MENKEERRVLNLSGASTKVAGLAGACDFLYNVYGYRPTDITGISSGALLSLPIVLRKWEAIRELTQTLTLDDIFDRKPLNEDNKTTFNAKFRVITGKSSLGTQNNLKDTLKRMVSFEDYDRYQKGDYPNIWVSSVDFVTGSRYIKNIKDKSLTYDDYINIINASASIPLAVEGVKIDDMILFDGAVRNHILSVWSLKNINNIVESVSVFARPEDYTNTLPKNWTDKNILSVFDRYSSMSVIEISKRDEVEENLLVELMNVKNKTKIKHNQIFIPNVMEGMYDTNPNRLRNLYTSGFKSAANKFTQS